MKEQTNYIAMCCGNPMRNLGIWPTKVHLMTVLPSKEYDGAFDMDIGIEHDACCQRFHCLTCDRYIGIAYHQLPKAKEMVA